MNRIFFAAPASGLMTIVSPAEASPDILKIKPGPVIWRAPRIAVGKSSPVSVQISSSAL